jgi:hypothetical protein
MSIAKGRLRVLGLAAAASIVAGAAAADDSDGVNRAPTRIRAADGRPCLRYTEENRPEVVMKGMFDHIVHVANSCPKRIAATICYAGQRTDCSRIKLPPYGNDAAFLGSMLNQPGFSFDYEEKDGN